MHYFGVPKLCKSFSTKCIHRATLDPKWLLREFWNMSTFHVWKDAKLVFGRECTISGYRNCENHFPPNPFIRIPRTNNHVCECLEHFGILRHVNWHETCVSGLNALFEGTDVVKVISQQIHLFNSIRPKVMFGSVLEHFVNLLHVKRCKTCVSILNAVFRGTEVVGMVVTPWNFQFQDVDR
jgi:hypothetical protein